MRLLRNLPAHIKARKAYIAYAALALIFAVSLALMILSKFNHHEKNILEAAEKGQLKVFDLASGKEVDVSTILQKPADKKPEEKPASKTGATPTMPIKQADVMFIIDNLGANKTDTQKAIELPAEFILAFSPYADMSLELSQEAKLKNHVTLADLPVQPKDASETPGNLALMVENNDFKNSRNFEAALSKTYQPSGVLTGPNDIFTHSNNFNAILHQISQHKIFLAYAGEGEDIDSKAKDNDVGLLKIDMVIPDTDKAEELQKELDKVETLISKTGLAVVMIRNPSSANIEVIGKWAESLKAKNIHLITSQH